MNPRASAQRAHGGFGAGVHQPDHLHRRHRLRDQLRQFHFALGGRAEAGADFENLPQRVDHRRKTMPQQQRTPGAHVVDVRVPVGIENARALAAVDEPGNAAHAAKRTHRRIHAARDHFLGARKQSFGPFGFMNALLTTMRASGPESRAPGRNCMNTSCSVPLIFFFRRSRGPNTVGCRRTDPASGPGTAGFAA